MLRSGYLFGVALTLVLVSVTPTLAQDQGGGIQGAVRDTSKAVLPGVVIEARSPSMPGVATAVSDAEGVYRFPSLRPGTYELTAALSGFTLVKLPGVVVRLGTEFRIDIVMEVATLAETVQVTAESPVIDVRQNAAISTLSDEAIELLPASGRNFNDLLTMNAGVQNVDSGISIDGASGLENHYIVDGLKTTAVLTGSSAQPVRLDFVEEIQVKSSGYTAEHGASMGGVVNIITKSGGDQFHGFFGTYYYDPNFSWNGAYRAETRFSPVDNRTPEVFVSQTSANTKSPDYEWLGDIGGPIVKQRYWFYLSNSSTYEPSERAVSFANALQAGPRLFTNYESNVRTGYTVSGALTAKLRARVTGQFENAKTRRSLPGSMEPDGHTSRANPATRYDLTGEDIPKTLISANIDYLASQKLFVNSKIGYTVNDRYDVEGAFLPELRHTFGRSNIGLEGVPAPLQFASGYASTPLSNSGRVREKLTRLAWDLSATYFGSWKGQHAIKAGLNAEWIGDDVFNGATAPNITLQWNTSYATPDNRSVRGPFGYYSVTQNGSYGKVTGHDVGVFVQDTWQPNARLTINAGVRTERELIPSYNPDNPDLTFDFADKIAPRLGFAWDVNGDARWKVYGSYGAFFDIMKLRIGRFHFGGEINKTFYYSLDTANWPSVTCRSAGPPETSGCPGTYFGFRDDRVAVNAAGENRLDPSMKPSRTKEYVIGLDHEIDRRTAVGVRYVRKPLDRLVEDVGIAQITATSFLFIYKICNPGYGLCENTMGDYRLPDGRAYPLQPAARRDYDAVELRFGRRLTSNFFLNGSFTWSYLRGNNSGLGNEDIAETTLPSLTSNFDTIFMAYDARSNPVFGRMPNDRPRVFKLQAGYTLPFGTSVAADYLIQTGELESTTIQQRSRYTFIHGRGDLGRVDPLSRIDLRVQHDVKLFSQKRINVAVDVRNLFDEKAITDVGHAPYRDGFTIPDATYFSPTGFDIDTYVAQFRAAANDPQGINNLRSNPFYRQPQGWQGRRTVQFSAKFRF